MLPDQHPGRSSMSGLAVVRVTAELMNVS